MRPVAAPPSSRPGTSRGVNLGALAVMMVAVGLQVVGAVLLKTVADRYQSWSLTVLAVVLAAVAAVDVARLIVWGYAHGRFPLSTTFPLSSLFYPAMLGVALLYGDRVGGLQLAGAALITAGVAWLTVKAVP